MKRLAVVIAILVVGIVAIVWVYLYSISLKPLYEPGNVRTGKNLSASLQPPPQSSDPAFWTVETGIKLHYFSDGQGTPVLVIHGGPGYPFAKPIAALKPLSAAFHFYYYDQRGSGQSTRPADKFTSTDYDQDIQSLNKSLGLAAQIADIERIRRILGQDKLILVGHSFGGFLASMYAAEFPEHVQALILVDPADILVMPQPDGGLFNQVNALLPDDQKKAYLACLSTYLDYGGVFAKSEKELVALNNQFAAFYDVAAKAKGYSVPALSDPSATGGWMVQGMYLSMGQRHDYRQALKTVTTPVLVIHGEKDIQPAQASQDYANLFPNAQFVLIPNAGHFPFADQPEQFSKAVGDFLNSLTK
jgi:proline iminopeptidase